jgi:hypothetical protein
MAMVQLGPVAPRWSGHVEFLADLPQPIIRELERRSQPADWCRPDLLVEGITVDLDLLWLAHEVRWVVACPVDRRRILVEPASGVNVRICSQRNAPRGSE